MDRDSPRLKGGDYRSLPLTAQPDQREFVLVFIMLHLCAIRLVRRCS